MGGFPLFFFCLPPEGKLYDFRSCKANKGTVEGGQDDIVEPGLEKPVLDGLAGTPSHATNFIPRPRHKHRMPPLNMNMPVAAAGVVLGVAHQVNRQHEEREAEAVVQASLGGDNLPQRAGHELVGKGPLGHGLRQDGVGAGDGGGDGEAREQGDLGHGGEHAGGGEEPHEGHDGYEAEEDLPAALPDVPRRELVAGDDELEGYDEAGHAEGDLARLAGLLEPPVGAVEEVGGYGPEEDAD